jgi:hypothetical protein
MRSVNDLPTGRAGAQAGNRAGTQAPSRPTIIPWPVRASNRTPLPLSMNGEGNR